VLLLHGGPRIHARVLEACDSFCPPPESTYYYKRQLGWVQRQAGRPVCGSLTDFVDEVERSASALGMDAINFSAIRNKFIRGRHPRHRSKPPDLTSSTCAGWASPNI